MEEEDPVVTVRFVIPEGKTEVTVSESLSLAHEKSQDFGLAPIWVDEMDVVNLSPTKTVSYLVSPEYSNYCHSGCVCNGPVRGTCLQPRDLR